MFKRKNRKIIKIRDMNEFEIIKMMKKRPKSENILYIWYNCLMLAKMH